MTRWILGMQEYNFDIIHCKGKENVVADILSRYPADLAENSTMDDGHEYDICAIKIKLSKDIRKKLRSIDKLQYADKKLNKIIDKVINKDELICRYYKVVGGQLYRKRKGLWKLYIPESLRSTLIAEIHEIYGHLGAKKLLALLQEDFTMDAMVKSIRHITRACDTCQKYKDSNNKYLMGETQPILPTRRGELVSIDYYGPLPVSSGNVRYIFVIVDNFTKFVKLYAVRRATTVASLRRLNQYIMELGKPEAILSDNGTQFTSRKWTEELLRIGIKPKFTAIRNPCTNVVERWNRKLGNLFRVFVKEQHTRWAQYIPVIETCLNEVYQDTIETTPWEAHLGQRPKRIWKQYLRENTTNEEIVSPEQLFLKIKEKTTRQAARINAKGTLSAFEPGDKVLIRAQNVSDATQGIVSKFCTLFEGPYIVKAKIGKSTYEIADCQDPERIRGKFNIKLMKRYISG